MLYGIMVVSGTIIATWFIGRLTKRVDAWELLSYALVGGLLGARLYHVVDFWSYYSQDPLKIFQIWQGGLGIFGGLIGGLVGLKIYSLISRLPLLSLLDLTALGLPLAQAIGRFGNYFNQELYGRPTSLPWGIYITPENRLPTVANFTHFHPLFLYEAVGCFIIFIILVTITNFIKTKTRLDGVPFFSYIAMYGLLRFLLEPLRIVSWHVGNVDVAQGICVIMIISGVVGIVTKSSKSRTVRKLASLEVRS